MASIKLTVALSLTLLMPGCQDAAEVAPEPNALLGDFDLDSSCEADETIPPLASYARAVAASPAFEACMVELMTSGYDDGIKKPLGPYLPHANDPFLGAAFGPVDEVGTQLWYALNAVRSPNDVDADCDFEFDEGNAYAYPQGYWNEAAEEIWFANEDLLNELAELEMPCLLEPSDAQCLDSSIGPAGAALAGWIWHEALHTHGYDHPPMANDNYYRALPNIAEWCMSTGVLAGGSCHHVAYGCGDEDARVVPETFTLDAMPSPFSGCTCAIDPKTADGAIEPTWSPSFDVAIADAEIEWGVNSLLGEFTVENHTPIAQSELQIVVEFYYEGEDDAVLVLDAEIEDEIQPSGAREFVVKLTKTSVTLSTPDPSAPDELETFAWIVNLDLTPYAITSTRIRVGLPQSSGTWQGPTVTVETAAPDLAVSAVDVPTLIPFEATSIPMTYEVTNVGAFSPPFNAEISLNSGSIITTKSKAHVALPSGANVDHSLSLGIPPDAPVEDCDGSTPYIEHFVTVSVVGAPNEEDAANNTQTRRVVQTDDTAPTVTAITAELGSGYAPIPDYLLVGVCPDDTIPFTAHADASDAEGSVLEFAWFTTSPGAVITSGQGSDTVHGFVATSAFPVQANLEKTIALSIGVVAGDCILEDEAVVSDSIVVNVAPQCASLESDSPLDVFDPNGPYITLIDPLCPWIIPNPEGPNTCSVLDALAELLDAPPDATSQLITEISTELHMLRGSGNWRTLQTGLGNLRAGAIELGANQIGDVLIDIALEDLNAACAGVAIKNLAGTTQCANFEVSWESPPASGPVSMSPLFASLPLPPGYSLLGPPMAVNGPPGDLGLTLSAPADAEVVAWTIGGGPVVLPRLGSEASGYSGVALPPQTWAVAFVMGVAP